MNDFIWRKGEKRRTIESGTGGRLNFDFQETPTRREWKAALAGAGALVILAETAALTRGQDDNYLLGGLMRM